MNKTFSKLLNVNAIIFLLALIPTAYFWGPNLSNQNARLSAIYAFVERDPALPAFSIDNFMYENGPYFNTIDWSRNGNHFYSNKAPGDILLGIIPYSILYVIETTFGLNVDHYRWALLNAYLINFFVSILTFAFSAVFFHKILLSLGLTAVKSVIMTLIYLFAIPLSAYNQTLWGLNTATSSLVFALFFLRKDHLRPLLAGAFLALSIVFDYIAFLAAITIFIYGLIIFRKRFTPALLGFLPTICILFGYQLLCFGSPFTSAKSNVLPSFEDSNLFLGFFSLPSLEIIFRLLISSQRGILTMCPILIIGILGLFFWYKREKKDPLLWLCAINIVGYLLFISSFNGWHGGATTFARYLIPSLIFWVLPIKECLVKYKIPTILLGVLSVLNSFVLSAISPLSPESAHNPLYGFSYQLFFSGNLSPIKAPIRLQGLDPNFEIYKHLTSGNLGQLVGFQGIISILPLCLVLILLLLLLKKRLETGND